MDIQTDRMLKAFYSFLSCLSVLHNYFDGLTKLFSDLYLVEFLDTSTKMFFLYTNLYIIKSLDVNVSYKFFKRSTNFLAN